MRSQNPFSRVMSSRQLGIDFKSSHRVGVMREFCCWKQAPAQINLSSAALCHHITSHHIEKDFLLQKDLGEYQVFLSALTRLVQHL